MLVIKGDRHRCEVSRSDVICRESFISGRCGGDQHILVEYRCLPFRRLCSSPTWICKDRAAEISDHFSEPTPYGSGSRICTQNGNPGKWKHGLNLWTHGGLILSHSHMPLARHFRAPSLPSFASASALESIGSFWLETSPPAPMSQMSLRV